MALPGAVLLPHTLLPLRIFEPRYRRMLAHSLERERMFCIGLMKPNVSEAHTPDDLFSIAGLGLVRACVAAADGTSNLVLQGLARVEFTDFVQEKPFRIAAFRELKSELTNEVEAEALAAKVLELCGKKQMEGIELPAALQNQLPHLSNPDLLADVVASAFVLDPFQRQQLLEQTAVSARLRLLIRFLGVA